MPFNNPTQQDPYSFLQNPYVLMGLGILSANKPGVGAGSAIGTGALQGMQGYLNYRQHLDTLQRQKEEEAWRQRQWVEQQKQWQMNYDQKEQERKDRQADREADNKRTEAYYDFLKSRGTGGAGVKGLTPTAAKEIAALQTGYVEDPLAKLGMTPEERAANEAKKAAYAKRMIELVYGGVGPQDTAVGVEPAGGEPAAGSVDPRIAAIRTSKDITDAQLGKLVLEQNSNLMQQILRRLPEGEQALLLQRAERMAPGSFYTGDRASPGAAPPVTPPVVAPPPVSPPAAPSPWSPEVLKAGQGAQPPVPVAPQALPVPAAAVSSLKPEQQIDVDRRLFLSEKVLERWKTLNTNMRQFYREELMRLINEYPGMSAEDRLRAEDMYQQMVTGGKGLPPAGPTLEDELNRFNRGR